MTDPGDGLSFDAVSATRLSADLHEMALRWLTSAPAPDATPGAFGTDPSGSELSCALPVFLARVLEARRRCCVLLEAAGTAIGRAAGAVDEADRTAAPPGGPR